MKIPPEVVGRLVEVISSFASARADSPGASPCRACPDAVPLGTALQLSFQNLGRGATFYSFDEVSIDKIR